jgi:hypothetical protein
MTTIHRNHAPAAPKSTHAPKAHTQKLDPHKVDPSWPKPVPGQKDYPVQDRQTLSHVALAAYGDAAKWPDILKANPGIKLRDPNTPLIGQGTTLNIPNLSQGWGPGNKPKVEGQAATGAPAEAPAVETPKGPAETAPVAAPAETAPVAAPAETAPVAAPAGPAQTAPAAPAEQVNKPDIETAQAFGAISKSLDDLEGKLKGLQDFGRTQVQNALSEVSVPQDKFFQGQAAQVRSSLEGIQKQVDALPPEKQEALTKLLNPEGKSSWPLAEQMHAALDSGKALAALFPDSQSGKDGIRTLAAGGFTPDQIGKLKDSVWDPMWSHTKAQMFVDTGRRLGLNPDQMIKVAQDIQAKHPGDNNGRNNVDVAFGGAVAYEIMNKNASPDELLKKLETGSAATKWLAESVRGLSAAAQ